MLRLPTGLAHTWKHSCQSQLPEADAAESKVSDVSPGPSAPVTAVVLPDRIPLRPLPSLYLGYLGQFTLLRILIRPEGAAAGRKRTPRLPVSSFGASQMAHPAAPVV